MSKKKVAKKKIAKKRDDAHAVFLGDGAGTSMDLEAIGQSLEDVSFEDLMDDKLDAVEVVYVEPALKRMEWVDPSTPISRDWLRHCIQDSHGEWRDHLPSAVQSGHLTGRLIPKGARSFSEVGVGKGLMVVELEEAHTNQGLVGQLAIASALTMEERMVEMERRFDSKIATEREAFRQEIKSLKSSVHREVEDMRQCLRISEEEKGVQKREIQAQKREIQVLREHLHHLQALMKDLLLSNKVKKRVVLTLARTAVEKGIGRAKDNAETWSSFILDFSAADWSAVGITKKLVKDLLADRAYEFNYSIHNIPAEEVVGSIVGMQQDSLRSAWEEIFFIAFQKRVSDKVFAEEVDHATHQQQMLGES